MELTGMQDLTPGSTYEGHSPFQGKAEAEAGRAEHRIRA